MRHSPLEDAQALFIGTLMCAFGLVILTSAGLVTGQTAGLAVLISYMTGWGFAPVFFVINIPFYALAFARMGARFTLKTFVAVALLSGFAALLPRFVSFDVLHPALAALLFGAVTGAGLLAIFRHGASLGGVGIVALYAQEKLGMQAGWVQLGFDALLFAAALLVLDPILVGWSLLGAVVVNTILGINHRRDRYIGT
ncbi:YitT family protein [Pararhodobacter sp.]|uniref:YitT family protein n=1 Tax=Pararhodobacter sp. TaxID=2127056 RepID=UPI002FDD54ED